jgi:hypothetical protein
LGGFYILAIMNNAAVNMEHISGVLISFPLGT